jgi:hypothetical protein
MNTPRLSPSVCALALAVAGALALTALPAGAQSNLQGPAQNAAQKSTQGAATHGAKPPPILASTQPAPAATPPAGPLPDGATPKGEPNVKRTVIEDNGSRIEELKVRGQTKRITVTPKVGTKLQYEVLPDDSTGMHDAAASQTPHGNEGRRVWNVLSF